MARTILNNEHLDFNDPNTWIPLFEIPVDGVTTYYFTPNPTSISIDGNLYVHFPVQMSEISEISTGEVPTLQLVCSNITGDLKEYIRENGSIDGEKITYKIATIPKRWSPLTTYVVGDKVYDEGEPYDVTKNEATGRTDGHIHECTTGGLSGSEKPTFNLAIGGVTVDNAVVWAEDTAASDNVIYEETLEILRVGPVTRETITLELGAFNPYTIKFIQETYLKDFCWNMYKGKGCWITALDGTYFAPTGFTNFGSCNKTFADCLNNTNEKRFNAVVSLASKGGRFV